jgi:RNA polymerase sigma factor (sigma-70 family)
LTPHRPGESLFKPRKRVGAGKSTVGYPEAIICQKTFYETIKEWAATLMPIIHRFMNEVLTARQREIVKLYFLEKRTEQEIAQHLGISAVTVSQHLFGKRRKGRLVGGAIPKLRKKLTAAGILKEV